MFYLAGLMNLVLSTHLASMRKISTQSVSKDRWLTDSVHMTRLSIKLDVVCSLEVPSADLTSFAPAEPRPLWRISTRNPNIIIQVWLMPFVNIQTRVFMPVLFSLRYQYASGHPMGGPLLWEQCDGLFFLYGYLPDTGLLTKTGRHRSRL